MSEETEKGLKPDRIIYELANEVEVSILAASWDSLLFIQREQDEDSRIFFDGQSIKELKQLLDKHF